MKNEDLHKMTLQEIFDLTITNEADSVIIIVAFKDDIFVAGAGDKAVTLASIATVLETMPPDVILSLFKSILKKGGVDMVTSKELEERTIH